MQSPSRLIQLSSRRSSPLQRSSVGRSISWGSLGAGRKTYVLDDGLLLLTETGRGRVTSSELALPEQARDTSSQTHGKIHRCMIVVGKDFSYPDLRSGVSPSPNPFRVRYIFWTFWCLTICGSIGVRCNLIVYSS